MYGDSACKNAIDSGKTDKNGLLTISKLEPGSYYIKETKAPKGYKLNSNVYEIKVTETKGDTNVVVENGEAVRVTEFTAKRGSAAQRQRGRKDRERRERLPDRHQRRAGSVHRQEGLGRQQRQDRQNAR